LTVVDAAVVLDWLLEEPSARSGEILALHVAGTDLLVAPELLHYEVGNVLATRLSVPFPEIEELFDWFFDLDIETYSLGTEQLKVSLTLANQYSLTVYDAAYVALAMALDSKLVTLDRKLANRASGAVLIELI